jgi:HNH/ENDO VII superfamily nuclease with conserved GHE residues
MDRGASVAGNGYKAKAGDNISKIIGTSDPQAIGNFMRANNLTSDRIDIGRNYFMPEDRNAYGDAGALGQATLDVGNARIERLAAERAATAAMTDPNNPANWRSASAGYQAAQAGGVVWREGATRASTAAAGGYDASAEPMSGLGAEWGGYSGSVAQTVPGLANAFKSTVGTVKAIGDVTKETVHGVVATAQLVSDQLWVAGNVVTGGLLADNVPAAKAAVERNTALGRGIVNGLETASVTTLRAVTGNISMDEASGAAVSLWNTVKAPFDRAAALNAAGETEGAARSLAGTVLTAITTVGFPEARAGKAGAAMRSVDDVADAARGLDAAVDAAKTSDVIAAEAATATSARLRYMGTTPDKYSRTGRDVIERMQAEGLIQGEGPLLRGNPNNLMMQGAEGTWVRIDGAVDMAHRTDAVTWWNEAGRFHGAKSPEVRQFMLDPNNYVLQQSAINRSAGANLRQTYLPPAPPASPSFTELRK